MLATSADDGLRQRILVLRKVLPATRQLLMHTDLRSAKVQAIRRNPQVTWLFYDHVQQVQLHIQARAVIHHDDAIADELWASETESSLRCYLAPRTPGSASVHPDCNLPEHVRGRIPQRTEVQVGRANFAVIVSHVLQMEWLKLHPDGNRRAIIRPCETSPSEWLSV
ncbi:MAG: pyridoxamine 5'-phosphate oxidase family protein [Planctomycetaceae bacterium]